MERTDGMRATTAGFLDCLDYRNCSLNVDALPLCSTLTYRHADSIHGKYCFITVGKYPAYLSRKHPKRLMAIGILMEEPDILGQLFQHRLYGLKDRR